MSFRNRIYYQFKTLNGVFLYRITSGFIDFRLLRFEATTNQLNFHPLSLFATFEVV